MTYKSIIFYYNNEANSEIADCCSPLRTHCLYTVRAWERAADLVNKALLTGGKDPFSISQF